MTPSLANMVQFILLILVFFFGRALEKFERFNPLSFSFVSVLLAITFILFNPVRLEDSSTTINRNISSVLAIKSGGEKPKRTSGSVFLQIGSRKSKKFNIAFHRRLEKHFPDWPQRIEYQEKQEKLYKSAMKKKRAYKQLRILDKPKLKCYTKEELDAIDYFQGTGIYKTAQDPKKKPNIFDTRQSFLLKMHNPVLRNNFLKSFNRIYDSNP